MMDFVRWDCGCRRLHPRGFGSRVNIGAANSPISNFLPVELMPDPTTTRSGNNNKAAKLDAGCLTWLDSASTCWCECLDSL